MPTWIVAGFWGLVAGAALIIGALTGLYARVPGRMIAGVMAFGSGVLISALAFDLMEEANRKGGLAAAATGFISGAVLFTAINYVLSIKGAKHRKRSGNQQPSETESSGSGIAIAIGALIDGIPESMVIGLSMLEGDSVSMVAVIAIFLSNLPEGLSSAAGMKKSGRKTFYILGVWGAIAIISALSSIAGYTIFSGFSDAFIAASTAFAAGAILAMIVDTMIPEAFEQTHTFAGLITTIGFLMAFFLSNML